MHRVRNSHNALCHYLYSSKFVFYLFKLTHPEIKGNKYAKLANCLILNLYKNIMIMGIGFFVKNPDTIAAGHGE